MQSLEAAMPNDAAQQLGQVVNTTEQVEAEGAKVPVYCSYSVLRHGVALPIDAQSDPTATQK